MKLKGTSVSDTLGKVRGKAIVVNSIDKTNLVKEETVIVTNENSPLYSLAFMRAKAIISEKGGMLSHLAIVARELRKPCVLGVDNITTLVKDGDYVTIDCKTGEVTFDE